MELQSFYKAVNQEMGTAQNEVGHFNIFHVEDLLSADHRPTSYSRRSFFKISLVTGHSKIHYADRIIEAQDNVLVFTNPMLPYHWERISDKQTGYVCVFTEAFFSRFGHLKELPVFQSPDMAVIPLGADAFAQFDALFAKMYQEIQGTYAYKYDLLRNLLMTVIHEAQKMQPAVSSPSTGSNASERIASLFAELLERQFPIEMLNQIIGLHTPAHFAAQLNVHVNHLNKALKEITGHTTSQLINNRILQEARILLKSTTWTINEIAWSLGFKEPNHFSAFFKSQAGITAKQFRKSATD